MGAKGKQRKPTDVIEEQAWEMMKDIEMHRNQCNPHENYGKQTEHREQKKTQNQCQVGLKTDINIFHIIFGMNCFKNIKEGTLKLQ